MKKHNFFAGPAILPASVLQQAADALHNFANTGLSLIEISHRSKEFIAVMDEACALTKELLGIGDDYEVLFLQGGASLQFTMVPQNLLPQNGKAAYHDTGSWAKKAAKEAALFGQSDIIASSAADKYNHIPKDYAISPDYAYMHFTTNNTIYGTQVQDIDAFVAPAIACGVPVVADMSSDFLSHPFQANNFTLIYAGAQKNLGPAGTTVVIVKKDALGKTGRTLPTMMNYQTHIDNESMFNTPPVFAVYVSMLTLRWIKEMGGLTAMAARNEAKAQLLYNEIDRNSLFTGTTASEDRSRMNATFLLNDPQLEEAFLKRCSENGLMGLKGHRSVGGFRASIYNALDISSVQLLTDVMKDFEQQFA